jgi:hypothetical protein
MFAHLRKLWDFIRAKRVASGAVESVWGRGYCELRLHEKADGSCWVTLVAKGGEATVYVPFEPEQAASLATKLNEMVALARSGSRTNPV